MWLRRFTLNSIYIKVKLRDIFKRSGLNRDSLKNSPPLKESLGLTCEVIRLGRLRSINVTIEALLHEDEKISFSLWSNETCAFALADKSRGMPSWFASGLLSRRACTFHVLTPTANVVDHVCGSDYQEFPITCARPENIEIAVSFPFLLARNLADARADAGTWRNVSYEYESQ